MRGIKAGQPQDGHGSGDRTSTCGLAGLWSGPGRSALQQNHCHRCRLDLAIVSPQYSQELLPVFRGTWTGAGPSGRGALAGMRNQDLPYVCTTGKKSFSSEQETGVRGYLLAPSGICYSRLK